MDRTEAKQTINRLRSCGVKVTLRGGQSCFSSLEGLPGDDKMKLIRLGVFIREILKEEEMKRKARTERRGRVEMASTEEL